MDSTFLSLFSFDITPYVKEEEYRKGDTIFNIGDEGGKLVYIYSGSSRCSLLYPDGKTSTLDYTEERAFYGEFELLGIQKYTSLVEAATPCRAYVVDTSKCRDLLLCDAVFLRNLSVYIATKLLRVNLKTSGNLSYPLRRRLAEHILSSSVDGIYTRSHSDTARCLSVSYRHLLYVFKSFEDEGLIERTGRGVYRIVNPEGLGKECSDD